MAPLLALVAAICLGSGRAAVAPTTVAADSEDAEKCAELYKRDKMKVRTQLANEFQKEVQKEVEQTRKTMQEQLDSAEGRVQKWIEAHNKARKQEKEARAQAVQEAEAASERACAEDKGRLEGFLEVCRKEAEGAAGAAGRREQELQELMEAATQRALDAEAKASIISEELMEAATQRALDAEAKASIISEEAATKAQRHDELLELVRAATERAEAAEAGLSGSLGEAAAAARKREQELQSAVASASERAEAAEAKLSASLSEFEAGLSSFIEVATRRARAEVTEDHTHGPEAMDPDGRDGQAEGGSTLWGREFRRIVMAKAAEFARVREQHLQSPAADDSQREGLAGEGTCAGSPPGAQAAVVELCEGLRRAAFVSDDAQGLVDLCDAHVGAARGGGGGPEQGANSSAPTRAGSVQAPLEPGRGTAEGDGGSAEPRDGVLLDTIRTLAERSLMLLQDAIVVPFAAAGAESLVNHTAVPDLRYLVTAAPTQVGNRARIGGETTMGRAVTAMMRRGCAGAEAVFAAVARSRPAHRPWLPADACDTEPGAASMLWNSLLLMSWLLAFAYFLLWKVVCVFVVWRLLLHNCILRPSSLASQTLRRCLGTSAAAAGPRSPPASPTAPAARDSSPTQEAATGPGSPPASPTAPAARDSSPTQAATGPGSPPASPTAPAAHDSPPTQDTSCEVFNMAADDDKTPAVLDDAAPTMLDEATPAVLTEPFQWSDAAGDLDESLLAQVAEQHGGENDFEKNLIAQAAEAAGHRRRSIAMVTRDDTSWIREEDYLEDSTFTNLEESTSES